MAPNISAQPNGPMPNATSTVHDGMPQPAPASGSKPIPSFAHTALGAPYEPPLLPSSPDYALHVPAPSPDPQDASTPDAWVPRDGRLLRLTGRHPLNCEPPMATLMQHGFITPPSVHYVRNHGRTPHIAWGAHRVRLGGLVSTPLTLSMDELVALPSVTLPVTLVCSGNRRKEVNMVKRSRAYHWGTCATATGYWTGVRLRDLLLMAGTKNPEQGARFVCCKGPAGEAPRGADGSYGTSLTWHKAMDPASDVIVAYKHNGRWLTPDHGFPVRLIIPGYISGRMVKWLSEITVSELESDNHYHFYDNRAFPPHVEEDVAEAEGWWYKPDTLINNLNINSAITDPQHDEVVPLGRDEPYTVKGFAYGGHGAKLIRVEVSLNNGKLWRQAEIRRFEKPNAYGNYWCWVHWDVTLQTFDFLEAEDLVVRAWDEDMNTQPSTITWNLMGMINNAHHRIKIHPHRGADGAIGLRFQHPAPIEVGRLGHVGWREEEYARAQALAAAAPLRAGERTFTMDEVEKHASRDSAWFVHEGAVYDATPFLGKHPGGPEAIVGAAGADATEAFNAIHSRTAHQLLQQYCIGRLAAPAPAPAAPATPPATADDGRLPDGATAAADGYLADGHLADGHLTPEQPVPSTSAPSAPVTLNPKEKVLLRLAERIEVTHNTRRFRFALPSPQHRLGLPCGKHVYTYATIDGETVVRPYTPISSDDDLGHMDLLIKVYFAGTNPAHPAGGKMSQYIDKLHIGDELAFKGPTGRFVYEGRGAYTMSKTRGVASQLSMVAGGTGITPIFAVMQAVLRDPEDNTRMSLLFANVSEDDILLRSELEAMADIHPGRVSVHFVISKAPEGKPWTQGVGFITTDMMRERLFPAGPDTLGLMCGPPGLISHVCLPGYAALGYAKELQVEF